MSAPECQNKTAEESAGLILEVEVDKVVIEQEKPHTGTLSRTDSFSLLLLRAIEYAFNAANRSRLPSSPQICKNSESTLMA